MTRVGDRLSKTLYEGTDHPLTEPVRFLSIPGVRVVDRQAAASSSRGECHGVGEVDGLWLQVGIWRA